MKIAIFPSASGDCVLVTSRDGKRLLADAGMPHAYDASIAGPLSELRQSGETIDVAYVSHIDRDHIGGILRLLDDEVAWRAYDHSQATGGRLRAPRVPRPPEIKALWHNAFLEDIQRTQAVELGSALAASANILTGLNAALSGGSAAASIAAEAQMLALSVGDAIQVNWRIGANQLDIPLNPEFGGKLMTARPRNKIKLGSLSITVLGPTKTQLEKLRSDWLAWLERSQREIDRLRANHRRDVDRMATAGSPLELADLSRELALALETDVTPPNLASLVLLVEEDDGTRLLLTGDAGDQSLLEYLDAARLLDADGRIDVDVLKVPHHGAHNSYSEGFVKRVRARHLIFCGDGEHHNPEPEVVKGYIDAVSAEPLAGGVSTTFWFNCSSEVSVEFRDFWKEIEALFDRPGISSTIRRISLASNQVSLAVPV